MSTIVNAPHSALRQTAKKVKRVDTKLVQVAKDLQKTLAMARDPQGVGLAAPQIDKNFRMFALNAQPDRKQPPQPSDITILINPVITKHSPKMAFGPDPDEPTLEGCLSIPYLYGPVPRWEWIEVEYELLNSEMELERHHARHNWFLARVIQHEIDHLDGILFTDYSLQYDLPVYQEDPRTDKFKELKDRHLLELF